MTETLRSIAALLFGAASLFLAGGITGMLLPLRGTDEGMDSLWLGLLGTGWAVGYVLGCLQMPSLVARVGHVRTFGVMASLAAISVLASSQVPIAPFWVLLRALAGFAFAGATMIVESWLIERSAPARRGQVLGVYTMTVLGASTLGQLSLSLGGIETERFFVVAAMLYSLALVPTAISASQQPKPLARARLDVGRLWRASPLALIGAALTGLSNGTFGTLAVVYASARELPLTAVTLFGAVPVLAGALVQMPVGMLSDRFDRRHVLAALVVVAMLVDALFIASPPASAVAAVVLVALFGAAVFTMYPILVAHANDHASADDTLATSGSLLLVFGLGSIAGPALAGALMHRFGESGLFATTLLAHAALLLYTLWRIARRAPVDELGKSEFAGGLPAVVATPQTDVFHDQDESVSSPAEPTLSCRERASDETL